MTKRILLGAVGAAGALLAQLTPAFAHCPLCAAATGALVATTRVMGIDDAIVGTFVGAFTIATAFWLNNWLKKKTKREYLLGQPYILSAVFLVLTLVSMYGTGLLGALPPLFWIIGMERLLFGILLGSVLSISSFEFHNLLRSLNKSKNHFPLQGIVLPIVVLLVADVALYLWVV